MRRVTYSMSVSLDGFVEGPDGDFSWPGLSDEVFDIALREIRDVGVHLLGRRLYEAMLYWDTVDIDTLPAPRREWVTRWNALPKVVFSTTLSGVKGNARLASGGLADEIERPACRSGCGRHRDRRRHSRSRSGRARPHQTSTT